MNTKELCKERVELFDAARECRPTWRVPILGFSYSWRIFDSDTKATLTEAIGDWELMEKIVRECIERYPADTWTEYGTRNDGTMLKIFPGMLHQVNDETDAINVVDKEVVSADELIPFSTGGTMFRWEHVLPRKFGNLTTGQVYDGVKALMAFNAYSKKMSIAAVEEYGFPQVSKNGNMISGSTLETLTWMRGIHNLSLDMRRRPKELDECVQIGMEPMLSGLLRGLDAPAQYPYVCDEKFAWLLPNIMSTKQFERFYYPQLKKCMEVIAEKNASVYMIAEGEFGRFKDFFADLPKGTLIVHLEQDDIFEMKKQMPDTCFAGGMPVELLGKGTPQECVDYANRLCSELGNTGYVFSQNKMMSFRGDATRENMLATQEFVANYRF